MQIEIIDRIGGRPLRIEGAQVLIRDDHGNPISVSGEYGPAGMIKTAHAGDDDFNRVLAAFGYDGRVTVQTLKIDPLGIPRGLRPIAGPGVTAPHR